MFRIVACCTFLVLGLAAQVIESQEYNYTVVNSTGSEDEVVITDSEGNVVSTVIAFPNEGYEVILSEDSSTCLIQEIDDDSECYEDLPVTEALPRKVVDVCAGRVVRVLAPTDCGGADGAVGDRKKRHAQSRCCRYTEQVNSICSSKYCCKKFLGICIKKCCNYTTYVTLIRKCIQGYVNL